MTALPPTRLKKGIRLRTALVGLLLCLALQGLRAQGDRPIRLELPADKYSSELQCAICDTLGLCLIYPTFDIDTPVAHIDHYDVNLMPLEQHTLRLPVNYIYVASTYHAGDLFVLYQEKIKKKKTPSGVLLHVRPGSSLIDTLHIRNLPVNDITRFTCCSNTLLFTSPTGRESSNLFYLPRHQSVVHGLFLKDAPDYSIDDFIADTVNQRIFVCANLASNSKDNVIWLCESDMSGEIQRIIDLPDTGIYRFQNARITLFDDKRLFIAGTYQIRKSSPYNTATGVYALLYKDGTFTEPELHPYEPSAAGKVEVLYLPGRLFRDSMHVALVTESFYPEYRYSTTYSYGVPTTEPIFMGYRFISADVRLFDADGHLAGTYDFPFDNMLVTNLTTHLRVAFSPGQILFYHILSQSLVTMLTDDELNVIDPIRAVEIFPQENRNTPMVYTTALYPWYKNYYLLSGYRFRNTGSTRNRNAVFFLNKLRYQ